MSPSTCCPIVHISIADPRCRAEVVDALHRQGFAVIEHPTGLHLIHSISGVILGDQPSLVPGLIVVDEMARGCSGASIAAGIRDLGLDIPTIVIGRDCRDDSITVVDRERAPSRVQEIARPRSPLVALDEHPPRMTASA